MCFIWDYLCFISVAVIKKNILKNKSSLGEKGLFEFTILDYSVSLGKGGVTVAELEAAGHMVSSVKSRE